MAAISKYKLLLLMSNLFAVGFVDSVCFRPRSPSEKRTRSSVVSPAASTQSVPSGSAIAGSGKEQGSSGLVTVPKLLKPKKLSIKKST